MVVGFSIKLSRISYWYSSLFGQFRLKTFVLMSSIIRRHFWINSLHSKQVLKAVPVADRSVFVSKIAYSPLIGGYAIVFNDGRAALLVASTPSFDPNVSEYKSVRYVFIPSRHFYAFSWTRDISRTNLLTKIITLFICITIIQFMLYVITILGIGSHYSIPTKENVSSQTSLLSCASIGKCILIF